MPFLFVVKPFRAVIIDCEVMVLQILIVLRAKPALVYHIH